MALKWFGFRQFITILFPRRQRLDAHSQSDVVYWRERADSYGRRAVLNLAHDDSEFDSVTRYQTDTLMPLFSALLSGSENVALDFGCGPGRFTGSIGKLIGSCIGMDPIISFLRKAPVQSETIYVANPEGVIPLRSAAVDVVWCCLVLGAIKDDVLAKTVAEIQRVLRPGGLLYLVENTHSSPDRPHWRFRPVDWYLSLFLSVSLKRFATYTDAGEEISVMAGRKFGVAPGLSTTTEDVT